MEPQERVWKYINKTTTCWLWTGAKAYGYGKFNVSGKILQAHRYVYELAHGAIAHGLDLDHVCRVRNCVNPAHLHPCTRKENLHAPGSLSIVKAFKERTHCANGHEYSEGNTYMRTNGTRECRKCGAIRANKYYHARVGR